MYERLQMYLMTINIKSEFVGMSIIPEMKEAEHEYEVFKQAN